MSTKTVNYSADQTVDLLARYAAGADIASLAESMGKTGRSIIAKLSREGVYTAKVYQTKGGEPVVKKDTHADAIGSILQLTEAQVESLTKCNKAVLVAIFAALANSKPI